MLIKHDKSLRSQKNKQDSYSEMQQYLYEKTTAIKNYFEEALNLKGCTWRDQDKILRPCVYTIHFKYKPLLSNTSRYLSQKDALFFKLAIVFDRGVKKHPKKIIIIPMAVIYAEKEVTFVIANSYNSNINYQIGSFSSIDDLFKKVLSLIEIHLSFDPLFGFENGVFT